ncbi:growth/differentiation factor 8-like [Mercenaria mercenaria]|uniref:growth/differentiation factor 8-like n=1 Tax=Mercenaria mercenaria TaxID=6596 RepID=UPI00234FABC0|nr:growth/differentiation factor 8-like [Mercenaria mercenaria]
MRKEHSLKTLAKCVVILFAICDTWEIVSTMPAADEDIEASEILKEKIETFKMDILNRLGYDHPPDVSNVTHSIEEKRKMIRQYRTYMKEKEALYKKDQDEDGDDDPKVLSKTYYSLEYKGDFPEAISSNDWFAQKAIRLYFKSHLSHPKDDHTKELFVNSAKLKVYFSKVKPENLKDKLSVDKVIRVNVYQILSIKDSSDYKRTLLDSKLVDLLQPSTGYFEIGKAVQSWVNNQSLNLGIELAADIQDINEVVEIDKTVIEEDDVISLGTNSTDVSPSVDIYAQEKDILKRVKRRSRRRSDCRRDDGETKCCRYPIKISFADIGWDDWVIAPHEYKGYYCAGNCPYRHKPANTFAGIKAILHLKHPNKVPSPCCVATALSPFTILHYNYNGKYQFSEYKDLVVEKCECG